LQSRLEIVILLAEKKQRCLEMTSDKNRIVIFDTTMRDGEQSPGASMSLEEKIQISRIFDELGVDIIEAGFPIASPGDYEAVKEISKILKNSIPCGLSRHTKKDIDACHEALKAAPRFRIHTFISTSPLHMKHKLNKSPEQVIELIKEHVTYARKFTDDVEWSCEDGTRTDMDFMCKTVELAINCGAKTINIPDTVGYSVPSEFKKIIETLINKVPNIDKAILSTHCHNDLGLAVANSLAGVSAGARQIECTINGIGERAGNAALEEIVMAIKTRNDLMPFKTRINTELLSKASKVVSNATGFPVQFNKAIVGKNAFAHESGIHQDGMLKHKNTYEIMTPESVGVKQTSLVMGKHSGRHAFKEKLNGLGYMGITDDIIQIAFGKFKVLADKKKHVYDEDIAALVDDSLIKEDNVINLKSLRVFAGTGEPQRADMTLEVYGEIKKATETGDGPVDAIFKCVKKLYPHDVNLKLYQVHAVTEGTDAQATVSVRIEENGKTTVGQAADTDTLVASANAYLNALNKMIIKRKRTAPEEYEQQKMKGI
jgi:2-isopropylmalate synthase